MAYNTGFNINAMIKNPASVLDDREDKIDYQDHLGGHAYAARDIVTWVP